MKQFAKKLLIAFIGTFIVNCIFGWGFGINIGPWFSGCIGILIMMIQSYLEDEYEV